MCDNHVDLGVKKSELWPQKCGAENEPRRGSQNLPMGAPTMRACEKSTKKMEAAQRSEVPLPMGGRAQPRSSGGEGTKE